MSGDGLRITLDVPRQVSVSHVPAAALASATHDVEVEPVPGGGHPPRRGASRRGHRVLRPGHARRYKLRPGTYRWSWTLEPIAG